MPLIHKKGKSKPAHVKDVEVNRALQAVYKELNTLKESVNNFKHKEETDESEGKEGDIKVVRAMSNDSYNLQIRGDNGWLEDKTAKYIPLKANVDMNVEHKKKVLPKHVGGLLPPPDYDSQWIIWDFSEVDEDAGSGFIDLTHNLGTHPRNLQVWYAPDENSMGAGFGASPNIDTGEFSLTGTVVSDSIITWVIPISTGLQTYSHNSGVATQVSTEKIYMCGGQEYTIKSTSIKSGTTSTKNMTDGYMRVLLWK